MLSTRGALDTPSARFTNLPDFAPMRVVRAVRARRVAEEANAHGRLSQMPKTDLTTRLEGAGIMPRRLVHTCPRARLFDGINADNDRNSAAYACFNAIRDCGNPSFGRITRINGMRPRRADVDVSDDKFSSFVPLLSIKVRKSHRDILCTIKVRLQIKLHQDSFQ